MSPGLILKYYLKECLKNFLLDGTDDVVDKLAVWGPWRHDGAHRGEELRSRATPPARGHSSVIMEIDVLACMDRGVAMVCLGCFCESTNLPFQLNSQSVPGSHFLGTGPQFRFFVDGCHVFQAP